MFYDWSRRDNDALFIANTLSSVAAAAPVAAPRYAWRSLGQSHVPFTATTDPFAEIVIHEELRVL